MDDSISRQAAIDTLKNRWKKTRHYEGIGDDIAEECELYLKQVPSAQPSVSKEEMVGDAISRQGVLRLLNAVPSEEFATKAMLISGVNALPSAQPEIVRCKDCKEFRRWIDTDITFCDCTEYEVKADDFCSKAERRTDG